MIKDYGTNNQAYTHPPLLPTPRPRGGSVGRVCMKISYLITYSIFPHNAVKDHKKYAS